MCEGSCVRAGCHLLLAPVSHYPNLRISYSTNHIQLKNMAQTVWINTRKALVSFWHNRDNIGGRSEEYVYMNLEVQTIGSHCPFELFREVEHIIFYPVVLKDLVSWSQKRIWIQIWLFKCSSNKCKTCQLYVSYILFLGFSNYFIGK